MGRNKKSGVRRAFLDVVLAGCACAVLLTPVVAISQTPNTQLPGGTYDSIKKLPDWSGMWAPGRPPADASEEDKQRYANGIFGEGIPLAPDYAKARDSRLLAVTGKLGQDKIPLSNSGLCIPTGEPMVMGEVSHEYLFTPGRVTISLENGEIRRIWTDGRGHPSDDESNPSFSGHSIGHWEGDTLVVDTVQIFPDAEIYMGGHVTPKTHIVERFTRVGDKMRVRTVITDPDLLAHPWTYTRWYDREDREPVDYDRCTLEDRVKKGDGRLEGIDFNLNRDTSGDAK